MQKEFKPFLFPAILSFLFLLNACVNETSNNKPESNLKRAVDSLQRIYAPDKRVKLWKYSITRKNNSLLFTIMVDQKEARDAVNQMLHSDYPEVNSTVELLPLNDNGMVVDALANNSVINLRTHPRHSAELASQARLGTPLKILKKEGEWYLVQTPDKYIAWTDDDAIVEINKKQLETYKKAKKVVFNNMCGFSHSGPDVKSQIVSDLVMGCILPVTGEKGKFYKVRYPDGRNAYVLKNETISFKDLVNTELDCLKLKERAKQFNGSPYLWGGTSSKAVDCSGFTSTVYFMNGIILQRDASQQTKYGKEITVKYDYTNLEPGDLLFFGRPATGIKKERVTHVALYIGDSRFIHASGKVRINSMDSTHPGFIESYPERFVRAVRIKGFINNTGIEKIKDNDFYRGIINF